MTSDRWRHWRLICLPDFSMLVLRAQSIMYNVRVWVGLTDNYGFGLDWPTIMGLVWADQQLWVWFGLTDNYGFGLGWLTILGLVWADWQLWVLFALTDNYGFSLGWLTIRGLVCTDWQLWVWFGLTDNYGLNPSQSVTILNKLTIYFSNLFCE